MSSQLGLRLLPPPARPAALQTFGVTLLWAAAPSSRCDGEMAPEPPGHSEVFRNTSTHCAKCWGCHNEQTSLWPWEGHHPSEETVTSSRAEIYSSVYATGVKAADLPQGSGKATPKKQCSNQVSKDEELFVKSGNGTEVQRARDLRVQCIQAKCNIQTTSPGHLTDQLIRSMFNGWSYQDSGKEGNSWNSYPS